MLSCGSATFSLTLDSNRQHEDGFASGLRVAAKYLDASPPFEIKHAERDLTSTSSDRAVATFLHYGESLRRALETPFLWLLLALVVAVTLLEGFMSAFGGALEAVGQGSVEKRIGGAQSKLREVKKVWQGSLRAKDVAKVKKQ